MKTTRIICGTDFSVHAAEAANVAAEIAMRLKATLLLIHVFDYSGLGAVPPAILDELVNSVRGKLAEEGERLRKLGASVEEELRTGSPYGVLVEVGRQADTSLIVVSSLGRIAPSRLLVGSVAERTAENCPVPTLVVRDAKPFQEWARGERALKIFLGYDFSTTSEAALRWVKTLHEIGTCDLTVGYISWPPHEKQRLGGVLPEVQELLQRDLREKVHQLVGEEDVETRVYAGWGRADFHLLEAASAENADLIVVGTHQRHGVSNYWQGSVSRGLLHHSSMSVAVVPVSKVDREAAVIPELRRVLVTTDFSDLGNRAIPYAFPGLHRGGTVCLLHVIEKEKAGLEQINECKARLRELVPADAEQRGVETQVEVVEDRQPARAICQAAERFGADLICMASHGRSGLSRAILGSVAHDVMTRSSRPLLVVRSPVE